MPRTKRPARPGPDEPQRVIAYYRVSTQEQADSRLGLDAQQARVEAEIERRGWVLVDSYTDTCSGSKNLADRAGSSAALADLVEGRADVLMVSKLDRLSRKIADAVVVLERSGREGWRIVALDLDIDTTTPEGEAMAHQTMTFAQWERRRIGQRTSEALQRAKARGVVLGSPADRRVDPKLRARIRSLYSRGRSYLAIAQKLNDEGVPTASGGAHWYASTVRNLIPEDQRR